MKVIVQKCTQGQVLIKNQIYQQINQGLVLLVAFTAGDGIEQIEYLCHKIVNLRIFNDANGVMNKSLLEVDGEILSISQFTLYADTSRGNRPSYLKALKRPEAQKLYDLFNTKLKKLVPVKTGIFGTEMEIIIHNDGPTTIILEK